MNITKHILPNKMTVLLEENHNAPVISYNILVKAGSALETPDEAGICHVIEHMIFKGTPKRPVGAIARDVEAAGGEINAYTSFDQTVFYINMASRYADKGLEIIADAVQNTLFDAEELKRESEVICEEIRRSKDSPSHCVSENLFRDAYKVHNYRNPIIGSDKTVKSFTSEKLIAFYRKWYCPQNMTCIIVGDFKTEEMLKKVETAFSQFKSMNEDFSPIELPQEPQHAQIKVDAEQMDIQTSYFALGFNVPNIKHDDIPALDILSHILAGAYSSRLEQIVKEKRRLVHSIYSYAYTPRDPGLFIIGGVMQPEKTLQAFDSIWDEVYKLHTEPPAADELNRAKINIRSSEVYEKETVGGEAAKLAYFLATADDHNFEKRYFQIINDITADDIRNVACKYLKPENCTVTIVYPKSEETFPTNEAIAAACEKKIPKISKTKGVVSGPKLYTLKNGIRLIIRENHTLPIVSTYCVTYGGLIHETPENNGISHLISHCVTKGTSVRDAVGVSKKAESMAGSIEGFYGRNTIGLRSEFLSEKLYDGFGLFSEVLCKATFDEKEVAREKIEQLEDIENQEDNLASMAFLHFGKALYGKHPYGLRMIGEVASIKKLNSRALKQYWQQHLDPKKIVISVVGDVSPEEVKKLANDWIKIEKGKKFNERKLPDIKKPDRIITTEQKKKGKEQAHIVLGFLGTKIKSFDHYKMLMLNNILAGQGGRLFVHLRDQMSLAYAINSIAHSSIYPGYFAVYIGTEPGKIETAIKGIKEELNKIRLEMVTNDEFERAREYLVGTYELDLQKNGALASSYAFNELYDIGIDEIVKYPKKLLTVTREDILQVAKKYITPDKYVLSIIRPS